MSGVEDLSDRAAGVLADFIAEDLELRGHSPGVDLAAAYVVPVLGNADRPVPLYVIRHGMGYVDRAGRFAWSPDQMSWEVADKVLAGQPHTA